MIKGFSTLLLYVSDLGKSLNYYRDLLGIPVQFETAEDGGVAVLRAGASTLVLHSDANMREGYLPKPGERGRGVLVHFDVDDVDALYEQLLSRGVEISQEPSDQTFGMRTMYVFDPDGYNLVFVKPLDR
jgi:uncharacterized glyoxalase superfamily protein PhnB